MVTFEVLFKDGTIDSVKGDRLWDTAASVSVLRDNGMISPNNKPVYDTVALFPLDQILSIKEVSNV